MQGQQIIAFAKDWGHDPTSCNHVLTELSKNNTVLWLNSIATRTPDPRRSGDLRRIWQKLKSMLQGPVHVQDGLWTYTPVVVPGHNRPAIVALNRLLLRAFVGGVASRLGFHNPQLWTWVPTSAPYLDVFDRTLLVYYCTDEWSQFSSVDGPRTQALVETLARGADVVFATSQPLVDKLSLYNGTTALASHGVDHALFSTSVSDDLPTPPDLDGITGPILGYYGLIEDWLDQSLLHYIASRHPEWTIVLLGKVCVDVSLLQDLPNVRFLGRKPHSDLPAYCRRFTVGLIPHKVNELTRNMNPIKLREYLSAGLPVVSTALPEVRRCPHVWGVSNSYEEFERMVEQSISEDTPTLRRTRSNRMRGETWTSVTQSLERHIDSVRGLN